MKALQYINVHMTQQPSPPTDDDDDDMSDAEAGSGNHKEDFGT